MTSIYYAEDWPTFTILSSLIVGQLKKEKKKNNAHNARKTTPEPLTREACSLWTKRRRRFPLTGIRDNTGRGRWHRTAGNQTLPGKQQRRQLQRLAASRRLLSDRYEGNSSPGGAPTGSSGINEPACPEEQKAGEATARKTWRTRHKLKPLSYPFNVGIFLPHHLLKLQMHRVGTISL